MKPVLNVALIGHQFMGKAHSHALRDVAMFFDLPVEPVMHTLCGVGDDLEAAARRYGWRHSTADWREAVGNPEVSAVSIAAPGNLHAEIALEAARRGKHVLCEKPLALNAGQADAMYCAAAQAGVRHMVGFNYRRLPAVALAKQWIAEGRLGEIYHFRAWYQQDWPLDPEFPFVWRMDRAVAGAGSMADKGSHVVDLARYLVGELDEVAAATDILVRQRSENGTSREVTTDDAAGFLSRFRSGPLGLFFTSRMSAGHKNALGFEVNGSRGSLSFDLERLNELQIYETADRAGARGFRTVPVTEPSHPYVKSWWPPGHMLGWEHSFVHEYADFLAAIANGTPVSPDFLDGLRNQEVLDAVELAAREHRWVRVAQRR